MAAAFVLAEFDTAHVEINHQRQRSLLAHAFYSRDVETSDSILLPKASQSATIVSRSGRVAYAAFGSHEARWRVKDLKAHVPAGNQLKAGAHAAIMLSDCECSSNV